MDWEKGMAYCGLACCVCSEKATCAGCRNDGCRDKDWCKNRNCCLSRGIKGCWECEAFPCEGGMLDKPRIRTFARMVNELGEARLMECLARNERDGVVYHDPGQLTGDYDRCESEAALAALIVKGVSSRVS